MTFRWIWLGVVLPACFPDLEPNPHDDPGQDHDGDGQSKEDGDCQPDDPTVSGTGPEYCDGRSNGCPANGEWSPDQEWGVVTWVPEDGPREDHTGYWASGTASTPVPLRYSEPGTLYVCSGTLHVSLTVDSADFSAPGHTLPGEEAPVLSGGEVAPVLTIDTTGAVTLDGLSLVSGQHTDVAPAGGLSVLAGAVVAQDLHLRDHVGHSGGAVHIAGDLVAVDVRVESSRTEGDGPGGGCVHVAETGRLVATALELETCATDVRGLDLESTEVSVGGGLLIEGHATLHRSVVRSSVGVHGGGIAVRGTLDAVDTTVRDGQAGHGGGLWTGPGSTVSLEGVTILSNNAVSGFHGGGIHNTGDLYLSSSDILSNFAGREGGGVYNAPSGSIEAEDTVLSGNFATRGGNLADLGTSRWWSGAVLSGVANAGGGLFVAEGGSTTTTDVAIWSNTIRPDDDAGGRQPRRGSSPRAERHLDLCAHRRLPRPRPLLHGRGHRVQHQRQPPRGRRVRARHRRDTVSIGRVRLRGGGLGEQRHGNSDEWFRHGPGHRRVCGRPRLRPQHLPVRRRPLPHRRLVPRLTSHSRSATRPG